MTYTIKDEQGNMICSIENVDPTRSNENKAVAIGIATVSAIVGGIIIKKVSDKVKLKKLIKVIGKERFEKLKDYISKTTFNLLFNVNKCVQETKDNNFKGIKGQMFDESNSTIKNMHSDPQNDSFIIPLAISLSVKDSYDRTDEEVKLFCKKALSKLLNKTIPDTNSKCLSYNIDYIHFGESGDICDVFILFKISHDMKLLNEIMNS